MTVLHLRRQMDWSTASEAQIDAALDGFTHLIVDLATPVVTTSHKTRDRVAKTQMSLQATSRIIDAAVARSIPVTVRCRVEGQEAVSATCPSIPCASSPLSPPPPLQVLLDKDFNKFKVEEQLRKGDTDKSMSEKNPEGSFELNHDDNHDVFE